MLTRPGMASRFGPSAGAQKLWITSLTGAVISSVVTLSTGRRSSLIEMAPFG